MLDGKKAIVTGSSRGIGKAIAEMFAQSGASVTFTYLTNGELAKRLARQHSKSGSLVAPLDVRERISIQSFRAFIASEWGSFDVLVNNAGINRPNDFDKISDDDWHDVLETNLAGPFRVTQELLPLMNKHGSIINISSVSGQYGGPRTTHYAVSKAGLNSLTQNLAIFCASKKIRVNAIAAGLIESEMAGAAAGLGVLEKILLKRMGTPDEVAQTAVFLASDLSSYITAQTINVNGGLYF